MAVGLLRWCLRWDGSTLRRFTCFDEPLEPTHALSDAMPREGVWSLIFVRFSSHNAGTEVGYSFSPDLLLTRLTAFWQLLSICGKSIVLCQRNCTVAFRSMVQPRNAPTVSSREYMDLLPFQRSCRQFGNSHGNAPCFASSQVTLSFGNALTVNPKTFLGIRATVTQTWSHLWLLKWCEKQRENHR